jgi:hypothetical protein
VTQTQPSPSFTYTNQLKFTYYVVNNPAYSINNLLIPITIDLSQEINIEFDLAPYITELQANPDSFQFYLINQPRDPEMTIVYEKTSASATLKINWKPSLKTQTSKTVTLRVKFSLLLNVNWPKK